MKNESKFILYKKDFDSIKADVPGTNYWLELKKLDNINFSIFEHWSDEIVEIGTYTKDELYILWKMLSDK